MIIVFGSINMDLVLSVGHFPEPGETVLSPHYDMMPGGRGANQALAALRAGAKVALVGKTGDDGMGMRIVNGLKRDGVMTSGVAVSDDTPTGMAVVVVTSKDGRNEIIVAAGANTEATADQIPDEILTPSNMLLLQTDMPPAENWTLLERARRQGTTTIVNMAPAIDIPAAAWGQIDYLVLSQLEARQTAQNLGLPDEGDGLWLAHTLAAKGGLTCIVTLGDQGSVAVTREGETILVSALPLPPEDIVDRTGASDTYCGTLAAGLHGGMALRDAMRMASVASALTCLRRGSQTAMPYLGDIQARLADLPDEPGAPS